MEEDRWNRARPVPQKRQQKRKQPLVLTGFAEEVDGVGQLRLLQLQLLLLNELEHLLVPENGEFWRNPGPLLQELPFQLHVAVWDQLTHDGLTLDLGERGGVEPRGEGGGPRLPVFPTLKLATSLAMALRSLLRASESSQAETTW